MRLLARERPNPYPNPSRKQGDVQAMAMVMSRNNVITTIMRNINRHCSLAFWPSASVASLCALPKALALCYVLLQALLLARAAALCRKIVFQEKALNVV
jgi:hypothetical protein